MSQISHAYEGSDLIIASLLRNVDIGTYIDVGANDPVKASNTFFFYQKGWSGLAVDGNAAFADAWAAKRPKDQFVTALLSDEEKEVDFLIFPDHTMSSIDAETKQRYGQRFDQSEVRRETVKTRLLADFRRQYLPQGEIHLLTLDVEGEDLRVLQGAGLHEMRPGVIVVETKGCSLYAPMRSDIVSYLTNAGYRLIAKTPLDAFFVLPEKDYLRWLPASLLALA